MLPKLRYFSKINLTSLQSKISLYKKIKILSKKLDNHIPNLDGIWEYDNRATTVYLFNSYNNITQKLKIEIFGRW